MRLISGLLILVGLGGAPHAQEFDRTDPVAVTTAFIAAYKARDMGALLPLVNARNRGFFEDIAAVGPEHPDYGEVFGGWRQEVVDTSTGVTGPPRYNQMRGDAYVPIGEAGGETFAVLLTAETDGWGVEDLQSPETADFTALPTTP